MAPMLAAIAADSSFEGSASDVDLELQAYLDEEFGDCSASPTQEVDAAGNAMLSHLQALPSCSYNQSSQMQPCQSQSEPSLVTGPGPTSHPSSSVNFSGSNLADCQSHNITTSAAQPTQPHFPFAHLPPEMQLRVFAFVPACHLTTCACCCSTFKGLCSQDALWRRLYSARWQGEIQIAEGRTWKQMYLLRDREECEATMKDVAEPMASAFLQMQQAKRQHCLGKAHADVISAAEPKPKVNEVHAWKLLHGFNPAEEAPRPHLDTVKKNNFVQLSKNTFVCKETGWVHVCDETCTEGLVDPESERLVVCPISGYATYNLMPLMCEEQDDGNQIDENDFGGRLARAYQAGYDCHSEKEFKALLRRF